MNAFNEQIIETKTLNGETEIGVKEEYLTISKADYDNLRKNAAETGKWSFMFLVAILLGLVGLLMFAYIADSLNVEINQLQTQIREMIK